MILVQKLELSAKKNSQTQITENIHLVVWNVELSTNYLNVKHVL